MTLLPFFVFVLFEVESEEAQQLIRLNGLMIGLTCYDNVRREREREKPRAVPRVKKEKSKAIEYEERKRLC